MTETFLPDMFPLTRLRWRPVGVAVTGGQPISGPPDTAETSGGGWWRCDMTIKRLSTPREIRQWRAFLGRLGNGTTPIIMPVVDICQPWPNGYTGALPGVPHSDGAPFSDGSLYQTRSIAYELVDDVPLRAQQLRLRRKTGGILMGGEYLTISGPLYGPRLCCISQVVAVAGDVFTVDVSGFPLPREDYAAGTDADLETPRCMMKADVESLADAWMEIERPFRGQPRISFVEYGYV
jgi:hypothetical protein